MDNIFEGLFKSKRFCELYSGFLKTVDLYSMENKIKSGALIGLSGGADSVMLLFLMLRYRLDVGDFPMLAVHINHGIRGNEADRDEIYSLELAHKLGVEALSFKLDCPNIRGHEGGSLEEVARNARYSEFQKIIESRNDISYISVAHNADDNIETVLFNLMRGTGTRGLSGIPPVRDNIIRPMLALRKCDIVDTLQDAGIEYMTDSTNLDCSYSRNYIREKLLPVMTEFSPDIHSLVARASYNLRCDSDFIEGVAKEFTSAHPDTISSEDLLKLHPAIMSRVIRNMAIAKGCGSIEFTHINKIASLLKGGNFSYSLPSDMNFICEFGMCRVGKMKIANEDFCILLQEENTEISKFSAAVVISDRKVDKISSNVYKFSIQADLSSAIINNGIFVRNKRDGDAYTYGGMSHKLKKLFNDSKIPVAMRERVPVFCDGSGILWVPGFGVRDDGNTSGEKKYITLLLNSLDNENSFFIPRKRNLKENK